MAVELRLLDAASNYSEILPDWSELTFSQDLVSPGMLSFTYPAPNPRCAALTLSTQDCTCMGRNAHFLTHGRRLVLLLDGIEPLNGRFTYDEGAGSRIAEADGPTSTYKATSHLGRFSQLMIGPGNTSTNTSPGVAPYVYSNATLGTIVINTIGNAMSRANAKSANPTPWFTHPIPGPLSATVDSSSTAWPGTLDVIWDPGTSIADVLQWAVENGYGEPAMNKKNLQVFQPSKNGRRLDQGANPVVLQTGRDFTEASYQTSSTELVNALLVLGDNDSCAWKFNQSSIDTYGYRESTWSVAGAQQQATLQAAGDAYLASRGVPRWAYTYAVGAMYLEKSTNALRRPFLDYQVGDWIIILDGVETAARRLRLLSATWPNSREAAVNLTVSDWFAEHDVTLDQRLRRLGG